MMCNWWRFPHIQHKAIDNHRICCRCWMYLMSMWRRMKNHSSGTIPRDILSRSLVHQRKLGNHHCILRILHPSWGSRMRIQSKCSRRRRRCNLFHISGIFERMQKFPEDIRICTHFHQGKDQNFRSLDTQWLKVHIPCRVMSNLCMCWMRNQSIGL
jgi:hypothetical protein